MITKCRCRSGQSRRWSIRRNRGYGASPPADINPHLDRAFGWLVLLRRARLETAELMVLRPEVAVLRRASPRSPLGWADLWRGLPGESRWNAVSREPAFCSRGTALRRQAFTGQHAPEAGSMAGYWLNTV
jgi:hypothetical protein